MANRLFKRVSCKRTAFLIAVYLFLISFLPFSHCHAIEENIPNVFFDKSAVHSHDSEHEHPESCCSPTQDRHDHHHFISEIFHYSVEKKKLFSSNLLLTSFIPAIFTAQAANRPGATTKAHLDFLALNRFSTHYFKLVSGISPPTA